MKTKLNVAIPDDLIFQAVFYSAVIAIMPLQKKGKNKWLAFWSGEDAAGRDETIPLNDEDAYGVTIEDALQKLCTAVMKHKHGSQPPPSKTAKKEHPSPPSSPSHQSPKSH